LCHGFYAEEKNGSAASELRTDAYDCIMVQVLDLRIQGCGAMFCARSGLPSDRHPDRIEHAAVLGAFKVWPGEVRGRGKLVATANLDSSCARRLLHYCGSGRRNGLPGQTKKLLKEARKRKIDAENP
jgi:hypothetical protein